MLSAQDNDLSRWYKYLPRFVVPVDPAGDRYGIVPGAEYNCAVPGSPSQKTCLVQPLRTRPTLQGRNSRLIYARRRFTIFELFRQSGLYLLRDFCHGEAAGVEGGVLL